MTETAPQFVEILAANADQPEIARRLLEAAGDDQEQVATVFGGFRVPVAIAEAAGYTASDEPRAQAEDDEDDEDGPAVVVTPDGVEHQGVLPAGPYRSDPDTRTEVGTVTGTDELAGGTLGEAGPEAVTPLGDPGEGGTDGDGVLRGEALEQALKARGLSTDGKADEKRARVAEYDAAKAAGTAQ